MKKDWMVRESELDDTQVKFLMATTQNSAIVEGCAGSGKSVLALIKARQIQKRGGDCTVIVFTKSLRKYMAEAITESGLNSNFYYYWEWKNQKSCEKGDFIIVDEIQDFDRVEIAEFIAAARKACFFFGDTAQSVYEGLKSTLAVNAIDLEFPQLEAKIFELYYNHRLPVAIARLAHEIGVEEDGLKESRYKNRYAGKPKIIQYASKEKQIEAMKRIIANRSLTDVGILLSNNNDVKDVYDRLSRAGGNYEMKYNDRENWHNNVENLRFDSSNPKIMTYHSAKGLQFETVFMPYMDDCSDVGESTAKRIYVAMTRSYKDLYILYSRNLPSCLTGVNPNLYETTESGSIEEI